MGQNLKFGRRNCKDAKIQLVCVRLQSECGTETTASTSVLCATVRCLHAALFPLMLALELRSYVVVDRQREEGASLLSCLRACRACGSRAGRPRHSSPRPLPHFSRNNKATMPGTDKDWSELSEAEKAAATTLGYDEALWNGNGKIPAEDKDWEELSDEQKKAAELLGMGEDEWDDSDDEGKARYEDVDWKHLLPAVKAAATELGYTEEMWDSESSSKKLAIEDKDWDELSQKERDLLKILGYNEDLWDD